MLRRFSVSERWVAETRTPSLRWKSSRGSRRLGGCAPDTATWPRARVTGGDGPCDSHRAAPSCARGGGVLENCHLSPVTCPTGKGERRQSHCKGASWRCRRHAGQEVSLPREDAERGALVPGAGLARPRGHPHSRSARRCSPRARLPATAPQRDQPGVWPLPMPRLPGASHLGRLGPLNSGPGGLPRRVAQHPAARGLGGATSRPGSPGLSVLTPESHSSGEASAPVARVAGHPAGQQRHRPPCPPSCLSVLLPTRWPVTGGAFPAGGAARSVPHPAADSASVAPQPPPPVRDVSPHLVS